MSSIDVNIYYQQCTFSINCFYDLEVPEQFKTDTYKALNVEIKADSEGNLIVDEQTKKAFERLRQFEETMKEVEAAEKLLRRELGKELDVKGIKELTLPAGTIVRTGEHTIKTPDTAKLKDDDKYFDLVDKIHVDSSLRVNYTK